MVDTQRLVLEAQQMRGVQRPQSPCDQSVDDSYRDMHQEFKKMLQKMQALERENVNLKIENQRLTDALLQKDADTQSLQRRLEHSGYGSGHPFFKKQ